MLSEITIGQYFPGRSVIHRTDPRIKLLLLICFIVFIFVTSNFVSLGLMLFSALGIVLLTKIPLKLYLKSLKAIIYIVIFTSVINLFYGQGEPLWSFGIIKVTQSGINNSIFVLVRIVSLILLSSTLTYTTTPTDLTDALERIMSPLKIFHVGVHEIAMMMTIALRFIPTLLEETDKIMNAQKSRGAQMDTGSFIARIKAMVPVLIPLLVSSFRRAYEPATAMECRCYQGGEGRTRMKQLTLSKTDFLCVAVSLIIFTGVILCNIFLPATLR